MLCDNLDGWDGGGGMGGRSKREGIYVYIQLIHFGVQQKLTQHCKAIILQLKKMVMDALEHTTKRNWHVHPGEETFAGDTMVIFKNVKGWKRK